MLILDQISDETTRFCHRTGDEFNRMGDQISSETTRACQSVARGTSHISAQLAETGIDRKVGIGINVVLQNTLGVLNDVVNDHEWLRDAINSSGGVTASYQTNGTTHTGSFSVNNSAPIRIVEIKHDKNGTRVETPLKEFLPAGFLPNQPKFEKVAEVLVEDANYYYPPGQNSNKIKLPNNKAFSEELKQLNENYGVYISNKPYIQPAGFNAELIYPLAIAGASAINPLIIPVGAAAITAIGGYTYCVNNKKVCHEYAKFALDKINKYIDKNSYFRNLSNIMQNYLDQNQESAHLVTESASDLIIEVIPKPRAANKPRIAANSQPQAESSTPTAQSFSLSDFKYEEVKTTDGKIKLIVYVPVAEPIQEKAKDFEFDHVRPAGMAYNVSSAHHHSPNTYEQETPTAVYYKDFEERAYTEYTGVVDDFEFEYRGLKEIDLMFLKELGYTKADWEVAMNQQTPCEPFLKGGPYVLVRALATHCSRGQEKNANSIEVHHMPSQYAINEAGMKYIGKYTGPSIAMTRADHMNTKSHGTKADEGKIYRENQKYLIESGRFSEALSNDIFDVQSKFPGKYDQGIAQLMIYQNILESTGYVK